MNQDLDAILRAVREVEASLDRRHARAEGAMLLTWGLMGAVIFAFYQLVALRHAEVHAVLGGWVSWVWLLPLAAGYVATAIIGARLGRLDADPQRRGDFRRGFLPGIAAALVVIALILTRRYEHIYGAVLLVVGAFNVSFARGRTETLMGRACLASGIGLGAVALALFAFPGVWSPGIAATAFLVAFATLGHLRYHHGS